MAPDKTLNQDLLKSLWFWISLSIRTQEDAELECIWCSEPPPATTRQPCLANSLILKIGSSDDLVHWIFWYSNVAMFLGTEDKAFRGYAGIFNVSNSCLKD